MGKMLNMHKDNPVGIRTQCVFGISMDGSGTTVCHQQIKPFRENPPEIVKSIIADNPFRIHLADGLHAIVVTNNAHAALNTLVHDRKRGTDSRDAVYSYMRIDFHTKILKRLARFHFHQVKILTDDVGFLVQVATELLYHHFKYFNCGDDFHSVRHQDEREHGAMIIMQMS